MKAALHERYGGLDVVELREIERPEPVDDQVLVRVHAASVNRADLDFIHARPAFARLAYGIRRPRTTRLGIDVAGVVVAVGPSVTRLSRGDRVYSDLYGHGFGAFAEYVCPRETAFAVIPDAMSFEDAATLPHSGILAVQGLRRRDGRTVGPGDRVLIDGASGNVGPFAVQVAKARGAHVTGVASTAKLDLVRSLGADEIIDYTSIDYTTTGQRYDWILDTDSHHPILRIRHALRPGGVYVTLGGNTAPILASLAIGPVITAATGRHMGLMTWWKPFGDVDVATLEQLYAAGSLRPVIDRRFTLDAVVDALRYVDEQRSRGKVVVTVATQG